MSVPSELRVEMLGNEIIVKLLTALAQAFESTCLVMQAHEPPLDVDRATELSVEISRKLVELAADGVTDPVQLRRLALESLPLPGTLARFFELVIRYRWR